MWSRRDFLRIGSLAVIGSIFVPRFERWFPPNRIILPPTIGSWGKVTHAVIYDGRGNVVWSSPLKYKNGLFSADFDIATRPTTVEGFAIMDEQNREIFYQEAQRSILPGDQARVSFRKEGLV